MVVAGNPLRIVVFGGIGSGKSTFCRLLAERGATVIEADRVGHEVLAPDGPAFAAVAARWPGVAVAGEIDRAALAAIVFASAAELAALEELTHPHIAAAIARRAEAAGRSPVVVELPVVRDLAGPEWIWVLIDVPAAVRLQRTVARGADRDDVSARMAAQPSDAEWHRRADWVVPNTGSLADLEAAAAELWDQLTVAADA